jgi:hypothetical protein
MILAQLVTNAHAATNAIPPLPPDIAPLLTLLPTSWAGYITGAFAVLMVLGRMLTALRNDGFKLSMLTAPFMGSSTTTTAAPVNGTPPPALNPKMVLVPASSLLPPTPSAIIPVPPPPVLPPKV